MKITDEMIEAAAKAGAVASRGVTAHVNERDRLFARAVLEAALAVAPNIATDTHGLLHTECDCVPDLGPDHCRLCENAKRRVL